MLNIINRIGRAGASCSCVICGALYETKDLYMSKRVPAGDQCHTCKTLPVNTPTQELLNEIYVYAPETGALTYKRDFNRRHMGESATSLAINGYLVVTLDKTYLAHRMIWLMQTGELTDFVDHLNRVRTDNSWANLRGVSVQDNAMNKSVNKNNTSGYLGVSYMPSHKKFRASITLARKHIHLGLFETAELANQARLVANSSAGFHTNHGSS